MDKKKGTITGREIMMIIGNHYEYLHDQLKDKYDNEFDIKELLEPFFYSKHQIYSALKIAKIKMKQRKQKLIEEEKRKELKKTLAKENNCEEDDIELYPVPIEIKFILFILITFSFAIYGFVKFIKIIFF